MVPAAADGHVSGTHTPAVRRQSHAVIGPVHRQCAPITVDWASSHFGTWMPTWRAGPRRARWQTAAMEPGLRIHDGGSGEPLLVLLHGLGATSDVWGGAWPFLARPVPGSRATP